MDSLLFTFSRSIEVVPYIPLFILISLSMALITGHIKSAMHWDTAYTRKLFHFGIFTSAALIDRWIGLSGVLLFGGTTCCIVLTACFLNEKWNFYLAIAREKDTPHQTMFIIIPMLSTAAGGLLSNLLFPGAAAFGYLVTGWGDAIAEPVGKRWGRHQYKVASLKGVAAVRSIEGSTALFLAGTMASWLLCLSMGIALPHAFFIAFACGAAGTLVEAISNHGLDNLTIQVAVSAVAYFMI